MTVDSYAEPTKSFAELLRRHRLAAELTQEELAERASISARGISDLERGVRTRPQRETVDRLIQALGLLGAERASFLRASRLSPRAGPRLQEAPFPDAPLPNIASSLFGRDETIGALTELLPNPATRLVTLIGAAGVGKSRLAVEVASRLRPSYPDGIAFVPLAALRDPALVPGTLLGALGVGRATTLPVMVELTRVLRDRRVLLVLDNLEQLMPTASPSIAELLGACPDLTILATSRVPLRLTAERRVPVPPLPVLELETADLPVVETSAAVRLFCERATAVSPDFALTADNAAQVAEICRRLDGLPLAIELAAVRIPLLSLAALLQLLGHRLAVLTTGMLDAPDRHRTLSQAIAWSYDLLSSDERALFSRLGTFVGGWTFEAAEAVARGDDLLAVLDGLSALIDSSLVRKWTGADGDARYGMLETIREFALDSLVESGEADVLRTRHAQWTLGFLEQVAAGMRGQDQRLWLNRLHAEYPNVRAGFQWAIDNADPELALRIVATLDPNLVTNLDELAGWADRALAATATTPRLTRGLALVARAYIGFLQRNFDVAEQCADAALMISRVLDSPLLEWHAFLCLSHTARLRDNLEQAADYAERASEAFRHEHGGTISTFAIVGLGGIEHRRGNTQLAWGYYEEALAMHRTLGDEHWVADVLNLLGDVACDDEDQARAKRCYDEALSIWRSREDTWGMADSFVGFADLSVAQGEAARAARLIGAADALYERNGVALPPHDRVTYPKVVAKLEGLLGTEKFEAARRAGSLLALEQVFAEVDALTNRLSRLPGEP